MGRMDFVTIALTVFATIYGLSDSQTEACSEMDVQNCISPMAALATEKDSSKICPVLETGLSCLQTQFPSCAAVGINITKDLIEANDTVSSACRGECTFPKQHACLVPVVALAQEKNISNICPTIVTGRDCLVKMQPMCTYESLQAAVRDTVNHLNNEHSSVCEGECSWPKIPPCMKVFDELEQEKNLSNICPKSMGGKECLEDMLPFCSNMDIRNSIEGILYEVKKGINAGCTGECTWDALHDCLKPMEGFNQETPLSVSCPVMKVAKKCMQRLQPECVDPTVSMVLQSHMNGLNFYLPYCPQEETTVDPHGPHHETHHGTWPTPVPVQETYECSWSKVLWCLSNMTGFDDKTPLSKSCPVMKSTKSCLLKIDTTNCPDEGIEPRITSTVEGFDRALPYCPKDGHDGDGCDMVALKSCTEPLAPMAELASGKFDLTKICPIVHDGVECFMKLEQACSEAGIEGMETAIQGAMTGLNAMKPYCPNVGTTPSGVTWHHRSTGGTRYPPIAACDMTSFFKCANLLAPLRELATGNFDLMKVCPAMHSGMDCFMHLKSLCTEESYETIKAPFEEAWKGLENMKPYCPRGKTTPGVTWPRHGSTDGMHYHTSTASPRHHCDWTDYYDCTDDLKNMQTDELWNCKIWWKSHRCIKTLWEKCHDVDIRNKLSSTEYTWERKMDNCQNYCNHRMIDDCMRETKEGDMEHQCSKSGEAKKCLHDLRHRCEFHEVWDWVGHHQERMEQFMKECMNYGHETGSGSYTGDGDTEHVRGHGSTGLRLLPSIVATFVPMTLIVVMSNSA